jgi:hypothetical protein
MITLEMHPHDVRTLIDLIAQAPLKDSFNLYVFLNQQLAKHEQPQQQAAAQPQLRAVPMTGGGEAHASD